MIALSVKHASFGPKLGQMDVLKGTLVSVVDRQGKPVVGAKVTAYDGAQKVAEGVTDGGGDLLLAIWMGPYNVEVAYNGHTLWKEVSAKQVARGETIVFDLPFCARDPILKPMDIVLLASAGALAGAGMYWKIEPLKVAGEVVFGASMFSIIYRLSCL